MKNLQRAILPLLMLATASGLTWATMDHPMLGEEAPAFRLPTLAGNNVSSADLRGQFIVLHFGAGW